MTKPTSKALNMGVLDDVSNFPQISDALNMSKLQHALDSEETTQRRNGSAEDSSSASRGKVTIGSYAELALALRKEVHKVLSLSNNPSSPSQSGGVESSRAPGGSNSSALWPWIKGLRSAFQNCAPLLCSRPSEVRLTWDPPRQAQNMDSTLSCHTYWTNVFELFKQYIPRSEAEENTLQIAHNFLSGYDQFCKGGLSAFETLKTREHRGLKESWKSKLDLLAVCSESTMAELKVIGRGLRFAQNLKFKKDVKDQTALRKLEYMEEIKQEAKDRIQKSVRRIRDAYNVKLTNLTIPTIGRDTAEYVHDNINQYMPPAYRLSKEEIFELYWPCKELVGDEDLPPFLSRAAVIASENEYLRTIDHDEVELEEQPTGDFNMDDLHYGSEPSPSTESLLTFRACNPEGINEGNFSNYNNQRTSSILRVFYAELNETLLVRFETIDKVEQFLAGPLRLLRSNKQLLAHVYETITRKFVCQRTDSLHDTLDLQLHLLPNAEVDEEQSKVNIKTWLMALGACIVALPTPTRPEKSQKKVLQQFQSQKSSGTQYDCSQDAISRLDTLDTALQNISDAELKEVRELTRYQNETARLNYEEKEAHKSVEEQNTLIRGWSEQARRLLEMFTSLQTQVDTMAKNIQDQESKNIDSRASYYSEKAKLEEQVKCLLPYAIVIRRMILERFRVELYFQVQHAQLVDPQSFASVTLPEPRDYFDLEPGPYNLESKDRDSLNLKSSGSCYKRFVDEVADCKPLTAKLGLDLWSLDLTRFESTPSNHQQASNQEAISHQQAGGLAAHSNPVRGGVFADIVCLNSGDLNWRGDAYCRMFRIDSQSSRGTNVASEYVSDACRRIRSNVFTEWPFQEHAKTSSP